MAQAVVTIAGRIFRMNCDEGEEAHIEQLAQMVDAKINELRGAFGEIGDQRIVVMAALTIADELSIAQRESALRAEELARARDEIALLNLRHQEWAEETAAEFEAAAQQVEGATRALKGG